MIHFRKVRWKNILSYGNTWSEVQLDRSPSTMILGKNGYGKSAIADALVFGLFGKPFRKIKKDHLINVKNGRDALVEVYFEKNGKNYLIRRGIKPNIFEIYENGSLINQEASSRDYQKYLEMNILNMDYHSACQIVFVGKAQHTTFMQLNPGERRRFTEILLNLIVFSNMKKIHDAKSVELRNRISEIKNAITVAGEKIRIRERYIADLETADKQSHEAELARVQARIDTLSIEIEKLTNARNQIVAEKAVDRQEHRAVLDNLNKHVKMLSKIEATLNDVERNLQSLENSQDCYACKRPLEAHDHEQQKAILLERKQKATQAKTELSEKIDAISKIAEEFETAITRYERYLSEVQEVDVALNAAIRQMSVLQEELNREHVSNADKIDAEKTELNKIRKLHVNLQEKLNELYEKSEYYSLIGSILQDKGIKTMLIKKYIPIINHQVNAHLAHLGLFVNFQLDENFDETIKARGFDQLGYNSFSEGEKLRMDMALLLAWREIAKMQGNVSTNLLIFDEIFDSSLDAGGAESLADLLTYMENLNVFIITHTPEKIADKVRSIMKVEKEDGFSVLR